MKKTLLSLVLMLMVGVSAWAEEGDVTTNIDVDCSATISSGAIAGAKGSLVGTAMTNVADNSSISLGNGSLTATVPETERCGSGDVVEVKFDLAFGKLSGKNVFFYLKDADGGNIASFSCCPYAATISTDLGCVWSEMYRGSNTVIWDRRVYFTITLDYKNAKITTSTKCYLSGSGRAATEATHEVAMTNTNPLASFVVGSNYNNSGRYCQFANLTVKTTEGAAVTTASYKLKYVCDGTEVKETATRKGNIGIDVLLSETDKADFKLADNSKKYIYVSDDSEGKTIADDGSTVVTINFREAATYSYTIKSTTGEVFTKSSDFEGESITYYYHQGINHNGTLATASANNSQYKNSFVLDSDNKVIIVTYTDGAVTDVQYVIEAEDIEGITVSTGSNADIRCSMGKGAYSDTPVTVCTLQPGTYKIHNYNRCSGDKTTNQTFMVGETTVLTNLGHGYNFLNESEEFKISYPTDVIFQGGAKNDIVDWIYITGTKMGRPEDMNDEFWTEALPILENTIAKATEYKAQVEATPSYIVGVNLFQYLPAASSKFALAIDSAQYYFENAVTTEEVYERIAILRQAMQDFAPTTPKVNETYTLAVVDDNAEETLYLNIDGDKPVLSTTPSYFQFHEYVDELGEPVEYAYYLYNTPTRRYLGLANGYKFKNTNLVTDKLSPVLFTAYDGNIWGMGIQGIQTVSYNGEVFIYGSADYETAIKGDEHAEENTKSLTWFIAREDAPETSTEAEEGDAEATATSVNGISSTAAPAAIYSANGARFQTLQKGMNIVRYADGTVKKVMVK